MYIFILGDFFSGGNQDNGNDVIANTNIYYRSIYNLYGNFIPIKGKNAYIAQGTTRFFFVTTP